MSKPFKQSDRTLKWYQVRARLVWGVFLFSGFSYAAYLHLNDRGQGRLQLLAHAPALARWLQQIGVLQPLPQAVRCAAKQLGRLNDIIAQVNMDRRSLFRRVWLRFADSEHLTVDAAATIAQSLAVDTPSQTSCQQIFADWRNRVQLRGVGPGAAQQQHMSMSEFVQCMCRCFETTPDDVLYLTATEQLKVPALTFEAEAELKALYDFVVAANNGSNLFTVPYLSALAEELGFAASEERARYFLTETRSVRSKQVALRPSDWVIADPSPYDKIVAKRAAAMPTLPPGVEVAKQDGAVFLVRSHVAVPVTSDEWVNFMADVMRACSTDEIKSACEVFIYLQSARPNA